MQEQRMWTARVQRLWHLSSRGLARRVPKRLLAGTLMPFVPADRIHILAHLTINLVTNSLSQLQSCNHLDPALIMRT